MHRDIHYRKKSLEELIQIYAFEVTRANEEDRATTQAKVVHEIYARLKDTFNMLDINPDDADIIYRQLLGYGGAYNS